MSEDGFSWTLAICQDGIQTVRQINLDMNSTKGRDCISIAYRWKFLGTHGGVEMGDELHTNSLKCMRRNKDSHEDYG